MSRIVPSALAAATVLLTSCIPPEDGPPARFQPNPPSPPERVDPNGQTPDPYGQNHDISPPAPPTPPEPAPPSRPGDYPLARPTAKPGEVISPYEPYNVIDVAGFHSGQLARDPSNKKIFRVP